MNQPKRIRDALDRSVELPACPRRIVCLVPSLTELLSDLGLDEEVVGMTTFCVRPSSWQGVKERVGGTKTIRCERIRKLEPDLVLANKEENTREDVDAISEFAPVYVTDVGTLDEALATILQLGELLGREEGAIALAKEIREAFSELPEFPPLRVAYLIWRDPMMCAGGGTFVDDMLRVGGFQNVFADRLRYPEITREELALAKPEAIFLSSEPFPFQQQHRLELSEILPSARVLLVNGEPFSWYGSRLLYTPTYLCALREALHSAWL